MRFHSFQELLEKNKNDFGNLIALRQGEETVTYQQLYQDVMAKADALKKAPVECVGLYGTSSIAWVEDMLASCISEKRTVLLDPSARRERTQALISLTGIQKLLPSNPGFILKENEKTGEYPGDLLFFTSGTTSFSKAVVLSQEALCRSAWNGQQDLPASSRDVLVSLLPLNHVFGFVCTLLWPLSVGACTALGRGIRSMSQDPSYYHATILTLVPSLAQFLLKTNGFNPEVREVLIGASPLDEETLAALQAKKVRVSFGYGLTETASGLAISVGAEKGRAMKLCPDTRIRIDEDGEVLVRTPCMMEGYYHDPEDTKKVLQNGELHTGDIGKLDDEGRITILGRKNDVLVLSNGEKVYCPEWEEKLEKELHSECALSQEKGKIILHVHTAMSQEAVNAKVDEFNRISPFGLKIHAAILHKEKLPRTITGKIQRWKLTGEK